MSYLAYPGKGQADTLERALRAMEGCEVNPSDKKEVLLLVTDTPDEPAEEALQERLRSLEGLEALVLVSAFNDDA